MRYIFFVLVIFLSSCSLKPSAKDVQIIDKFLIPIPQNIQNLDKKIDKNVKISQIVAPKFLYTKNIIYTKGDGIYGSYLYSFWEESPAKQLEFILSNSLSSVYKNVFIEPSIAKADLALESKVEVFEYFLHEEKSKVKFKINLFLIDLRDFSVIKSKDFYIVENVKEKNPKGIVAGFKKVIKRFNEEVFIWLSKTSQNFHN